MKSIFLQEKIKGGTHTNVFADISKRDTYLVKRVLTKEELMELNELPKKED